MIVANPEAREVGTNVKAAIRVDLFLSQVNFFREYMYTRIDKSLLLGSLRTVPYHAGVIPSYNLGSLWGSYIDL